MDPKDNKFLKLFNKQKKHQYYVGNTSCKERLKKLNALQKAVETTYRQQIREALYSDFNKPHLETDVTEIYQVVSELKFAKRHLRSWMQKQKVTTPLALSGTSSWFSYEPKGVCLIISPWNFPLNLTFGPLVSAIAAGNTVILKPSEMTPHIAAVMSEMVKELFPEEEVSLVEGGVEVAQALLKLPFNHIFFTGSPAVGKLVMKAAAEHLSTITLELGGKSPTIVDDTANLKKAAKKIAWGKFLNAGQICVSPDYILVKKDISDKLIAEIKQQIHSFYSHAPATSKSYSRIVNDRHFNRLLGLLEDAKEKGATVEIGGNYSAEDRYLEPTVLSNIPENGALMQQEIFGPLLPVIEYKTAEEAIEYINAGEKPLALYIYSNNRKTVAQILENTRAGSSCINNNVLQYANHHLPFGGINNSGMGKSHGLYGFQEFSNQRAILKQHTITAMELLFPPYNKFKQKIADFTVKWL